MKSDETDNNDQHQKDSRMNKFVALIAAAAFAATFALAGAAHAGKPVDDEGNPLGNGFPSGPHFNLNILGKKLNFTCPEVDLEDLGHVIFVPREVPGGDRIQIIVESGKKGPKNNPDATDLEVVDPCTETFPDTPSGDEDPATFRLPKNADGYAVFGRITGKPTDDPTFTFTDRTITLVEDEFGNNLLLLGVIIAGKTFDVICASPDDPCELVRTDTTKPGKGVQKAKEITAIFEFSGLICIEDVAGDLFDDFCVDDPDPPFCAATDLCCLDGILAGGECSLLTDALFDDGFGNFVCDNADDIGSGIDWVQVGAQCKSFADEWIFNIEDFVNVLFEADNNGSYTVQLRFYPLPLN